MPYKDKEVQAEFVKNWKIKKHYDDAINKGILLSGKYLIQYNFTEQQINEMFEAFKSHHLAQREYYKN